MEAHLAHDQEYAGSCPVSAIYSSIMGEIRKESGEYFILEITKNEAMKLAEKGLEFHKDLFTGKWKRRRYYLREDWECRNIKMLNEIRNKCIK